MDSTSRLAHATRPLESVTHASFATLLLERQSWPLPMIGFASASTFELFCNSTPCMDPCSQHTLDRYTETEKAKERQRVTTHADFTWNFLGHRSHSELHIFQCSCQVGKLAPTGPSESVKEDERTSLPAKFSFALSIIVDASKSCACRG